MHRERHDRFPAATRQLALDFGTADGAGRLADADWLAVQRKRLASHLSMALGRQVEVRFTRNRRTMISYRARAGGLTVRLHRMFALADDPVLHAVALFLCDMPVPSAKALLHTFIETHRADCTQDRARAVKVTPQGRYVDLEAVLRAVAGTYFPQVDLPRIGWGRRAKRRRRAVSRTLATYSYDDRVIRVNPILDSGDVPRFVLEWVVYHEMLHHVLPPVRSGGRNLYHTARFREMERRFVRYAEAREWERRNLDWLLARDRR